MVDIQTSSLIMAAGRGSRMAGYSGNKALLPLIPGADLYEGGHPIIFEILNSLPEGPRAVVVHHCAEEVMAATRGMGLTYCRQPELNGTGGALLAAAGFIEATPCEALVITMGDVPLVTRGTYRALVDGLAQNSLMVLGFEPRDPRRYGVLETTASGRLTRITEWAYWKDYPPERRAMLRIFNAGIYAVRRPVLLHSLALMAERPHKVQKDIGGVLTTIKEYFLTDLVEYLLAEGTPVGYHVAGDELEVMGVDDPASLQLVQSAFAARRRH